MPPKDSFIGPQRYLTHEVRYNGTVLSLNWWFEWPTGLAGAYYSGLALR